MNGYGELYIKTNKYKFFICRNRWWRLFSFGLSISLISASIIATSLILNSHPGSEMGILAYIHYNYIFILFMHYILFSLI